MPEDEHDLMTRPERSVTKSDKTTVLKREQDILRLLLAGGDFDDIRQYASAQGWGVGDRQLRRYQERAFRKLAGATTRDSRELLGRHLMQRRALFARASKSSDLRTALAVLKDEATLEGLYNRPTESPLDGLDGLISAAPEDRLRRLCEVVKARLDEDEEEARLVNVASPKSFYRFPDTQIPEMMLYILTNMHVCDQLDRGGMLMMALWRLLVGDRLAEFWERIGSVYAWNFHVGAEGWRIFTERLGLDGDELIRANSASVMLDHFQDQIENVCPEKAEIEKLLAESEMGPAKLITPEEVADQWRELLGEVLGE